MESRYANFFQVGHNAYEVIIEFGQLYPADEAPLMHTRIVTSLPYAQELLNTLQETLVETSGDRGPA